MTNKVFTGEVKKFYIFIGIIAALLVISSYLITPIFLPLAVSCFLSYLLAPTVDYIHGRFKVPRGLVTFFSLIMISTFFVALVSGLIPYLVSQAQEIYALGSDALEKLVPHWVYSIRKAVVEYGIMSGEKFDYYVYDASTYSSAIGQFGSTINSLWQSTPMIIGRIANFALVPIFTFFILKDLPTIRSYIWKVCPVDLRKPFAKSMEDVDNTISSLIRGQFLIAMIDGILYMLLFSVLGLKGAIVIGLAGGISRLVPYLDIIVTSVLSSLVVLTNFESGWIFMWIALGITTIQTFDGVFMLPRILGGRVGLHPGVVIASMITFATWYGFWGLLIAIPVVALLKLATTSIFSLYYASEVYCPSDSSE